MDMTALLLSRIQFAATVSFHIIFPAFTVGLAAWLVVLEATSLASGRLIYRRLFDFWRDVFAVAFGMGVVSGVGLALGLDAPMLKMVLLTGLLPSVTEVPMLSIAHGTYAQKAAATTMISTIFAIVSISVGVAIAVRLGG